MEELKKRINNLECLLIIKNIPEFNYLCEKVWDIEDRIKKYNLTINKTLYANNYPELRKKYELLLKIFS